METDSHNHDVIIIGAGLAGLVAAESLKSRDENLNVIVLEAASQVGGRISAQRIEVVNSDPQEVDVGGEWILSSQINVLRLIDRLGLQTSPPDAEHGSELKKLTQVGRKSYVRSVRAFSGAILPTKFGWRTGVRSWIAGLELSYVAWRFDTMASAIDLLHPYNCAKDFGDNLKCSADLDSTTVETYLRAHTYFRSVRDIIQIQFQLVSGFDLTQMSLLFMLFYVKSQNPDTLTPFSTFLWGDPTSQVLRVKNGAFQICRRIAKLVGNDRVHVNHVVESVSFENFVAKDKDGKDSRVFVTTNTGMTFRCKRVIVATPPNAIRRIQFFPDLPPKKKFLLDRMSQGATIKFYASYDEAYWKLDGFSGEFISNGGKRGMTVNESGTYVSGGPVTWLTDGTASAKAPMLVGFLAGRRSVEWSQVTDDELKFAILDQLGSLFGSWARTPVGFAIKNWLEDPFANGGTVSIPSVGTMFAYESLRQPYGPLHFAGSEMAIKCVGSISGAVESGQRVAIEVLDEIRPQSLNAQDYTLMIDYTSKPPQPHGNGDRMTKSVVRVAMMVPVLGICLGCFAYRMCDKYGKLLIPH